MGLLRGSFLFLKIHYYHHNMITFYGTAYCPDCVRSKKLLDEEGVKYRYIGLEDNPDAADEVIKLNNGMQSVPTIIFDDGSVLTEPSNEELLLKIQQK